MSNIKILIILALVIAAAIVANYFRPQKTSSPSSAQTDQKTTANPAASVNSLNPLTIESLRKGNYPGSDLVIEETLRSGSNYARYIASYKSEGLKIFGLLTIPNGHPPAGGPAAGWPVIIFNHGYIVPSEYKTTEKYVAYQDGFAKEGYITFKSDYRGHGDSEGQARGAYGYNDYTVDVLNALESLKKYKDANPEKIGIWGHSLGGFITLRSMVVSPDIKAGVIWSGVVGDFDDIFNHWHHPDTATAAPNQAKRWRDLLVEKYGAPPANPDFWHSVSANYYLQDISGSLQLQASTGDTEVPIEFSSKLEKELKAVGKEVELITYSNDDHNLSKNLSSALDKSVQFFDKYLKN